MKNQIIIIAGPTASGKTNLAISLAEKLDCPILSADSRQLYKELNIGVAKPSKAELARAQHYFIDSVSIHDYYSAGQWSKDAKNTIENIFEKQNKSHCIIAGGSGLHVKSLIDGLPSMPKVPEDIRVHYQNKFDTQGLELLCEELKAKDPEYFEKVDQQNPHRIMRALCAIEASKLTFTELRNRPANPLPYETKWLILNPDRKALHHNIERRVDKMIEQGLEQEAKSLYPFRALDALQTIGYKEWWACFENKQSSSKTIEQIKASTRQYARRQLTWNRKLEGLRLLEAQPETALKYIHS